MTATLAESTAVTLLRRLAELPDGAPERAQVRCRTIEAWLPLAKHLAQRFHGRGEPIDDLVQIDGLDEARVLAI